MGRQPVVTGGKAQEPTDVKHRNNLAVEVDYTEGNGWGLRQGGYCDHGQNPLHHGKRQGILLLLNNKGHKLEDGTLLG
jgi:hypothetical protein